MKKIFIATAILIASLFIFVVSPKKVSAQDNLPRFATFSKSGYVIEKYFQKGKDFSKEKWSDFQTVRDNYFSEPIEAKGLTFTTESGEEINKAFFSISSKLRIHPVIKITDEDGNEIKVSSWQARGENSKFLFIETIGYSRAKTSYSSGDNPLLPNDKYYVLALRIPNGEKNSQEIWPVPVSKNEFKRLKALKTSAIGEKVTPIDGYNY